MNTIFKTIVKTTNMKKLKVLSTPKKVFVSGIVGLIMTLTVILLLTSCGKDLPETVITYPVISTLEATSVTTTSVVSGGNISSDGGANVTVRGLCYGLISNPSMNDNKTTDGVGTGNFSHTLSGLTPGTSYHVRAYATTSLGTFYGNDVAFATDPIMYLVTVTSGPNGTTSPILKEVASGTSLDVKATPNVGFMTDSIKVDEKSFPLNGSTSYTIMNVLEKTAVYVTFKPDPKWILSQHPWYTVKEQNRYVNTTTWHDGYPSTGILINKYEFYQSGNDFKIKTSWPDKGGIVYEYVCTLKEDSLIFSGNRMQITHLDPQSLVLKRVIKYYDFDGKRVPEKDIDAQYFFEETRSYK